MTIILNSSHPQGARKLELHFENSRVVVHHGDNTQLKWNNVESEINPFHHKRADYWEISIPKESKAENVFLILKKSKKAFEAFLRRFFPDAQNFKVIP